MAGNQGLGSDKMSDKQKHEIQSMGGKESPAKFTPGSKKAREAGRRGGKARRNT